MASSSSSRAWKRLKPGLEAAAPVCRPSVPLDIILDIVDGEAWTSLLDSFPHVCHQSPRGSPRRTLRTHPEIWLC
jgi:hypothetical protein